MDKSFKILTNESSPPYDEEPKKPRRYTACFWFRLILVMVLLSIVVITMAFWFTYDNRRATIVPANARVVYQGRGVSFEPYEPFGDDYAGFEDNTITIDNTVFGRLNAFFEYILFCGSGKKQKPVIMEAAEDIPKMEYYTGSDATTGSAESPDVDEGTVSEASAAGTVPLLAPSADSDEIFHSLDFGIV